MKKERIVKFGDGVLEQIKNIIPYNAKPAVFIPYEVGEYSMIIKEDLGDTKQVGLYNDTGTLFKTKEIVSTPESSILYFDDKLNDIFTGFIYRGWVTVAFAYESMEQILTELCRAGHISIGDYLKLRKINGQFK